MDAVGSFLAVAVRYVLGHHDQIFWELHRLVISVAALILLIIGIRSVIRGELRKKSNKGKKRAAKKERKSAAKIVGKRTRSAKSAIRKAEIAKKSSAK